ncbi:MAG TPA: hypothetical protein VFL55_20545 [Acetobacteraceae bacterium]|nr:hypothetical protein [Acetobacteraceae bacterium]
MDQPADLHPTTSLDDLEDFDTVFASDLMEMVFDTMRVRANEDPERQAVRRKAAVAAVAAMNQQDPVGMMFAAHAVASHHAVMECFRRAMVAVNDPGATTRMHRNAALLSRMMAETVKGLAGRLQKPEPSCLRGLKRPSDASP